MIDNLSLLISHGLFLIACWRLLSRHDLDAEDGGGAPGFLAGRNNQLGRNQPPGAPDA